MKRLQAETAAFLLTAVWLGLKLLTYIFTGLLNVMRWPLHILFAIACLFWFYYLWLDAQYRKRRQGRK